MSFREFHITLTNNATATPPGAPVAVGVMLKKYDEHLCHGEYTDDVPAPDTINPGQTVEWASESDGIGTGCEGRVKYQIVAADTAADPHGFLCITWDNPFDFGVTYPPDTQVNNSDIGTNDCEIQRFLPPTLADIENDPNAANDLLEGKLKGPAIQFVTNGFEFDVNFSGHSFQTGGWEYLVAAEALNAFMSPQLVPLLLLGSPAIVPHAFATLTFQNIPGSFKEHARRWNERAQATGWHYDPSSGVRHLLENQPVISLRQLMDLRRL